MVLAVGGVLAVEAFGVRKAIERTGQPPWRNEEQPAAMSLFVTSVLAQVIGMGFLIMVGWVVHLICTPTAAVIVSLGGDISLKWVVAQLHRDKVAVQT